MEKTVMLNVYTVIIDGIDKSGKDTIARYVWRLDKRLNLIIRAWPSLVVYAKKFNRNCDYALPWTQALYVHCEVEEEDWKLRCKINNEDISNIDYHKDRAAFDEAFEELTKNGYNVMHINTSKITAYEAAKLIVYKIHQLNKGGK